MFSQYTFSLFGATIQATVTEKIDSMGMMSVQMYDDEKYRIIPTPIHPSGNIGSNLYMPLL